MDFEGVFPGVGIVTGLHEGKGVEEIVNDGAVERDFAEGRGEGGDFGGGNGEAGEANEVGRAEQDDAGDLVAERGQPGVGRSGHGSGIHVAGVGRDEGLGGCGLGAGCGIREEGSEVGAQCFRPGRIEGAGDGWGAGCH